MLLRHYFQQCSGKSDKTRAKKRARDVEMMNVDRTVTLTHTDGYIHEG